MRWEQVGFKPQYPEPIEDCGWSGRLPIAGRSSAPVRSTRISGDMRPKPKPRRSSVPARSTPSAPISDAELARLLLRFWIANSELVRKKLGIELGRDGNWTPSGARASTLRSTIRRWLDVIEAHIRSMTNPQRIRLCQSLATERTTARLERDSDVLTSIRMMLGLERTIARLERDADTKRALKASGKASKKGANLSPPQRPRLSRTDVGQRNRALGQRPAKGSVTDSVVSWDEALSVVRKHGISGRIIPGRLPRYAPDGKAPITTEPYLRAWKYLHRRFAWRRAENQGYAEVQIAGVTYTCVNGYWGSSKDR